MAFTTIVIVGIIIFIIFIAIRGVATRGKIDAGLYKNVAYVNWDTGVTCDIDIDYSNPAAIIRYDVETGKPYILRKAGNFDKGDKKVWLGFFEKKEYHGWTFILDGIDSLHKDLKKLLEQLTSENQMQKGLLSEKDARILILEGKIEAEFEKKIKLQEEMNEASRKGIVFKQSGSR